MSVLSPCPFCGSHEIDWVVPAYADHVHMACDDCGARGPMTSLGKVSRNDRAAITALALSGWNDRVAS